MKIMLNSFGNPEIQQKIEIIELEVLHELKEELEKASWFQKHNIRRIIKKEIKQRADEKFGSDYSV